MLTRDPTWFPDIFVTPNGNPKPMKHLLPFPLPPAPVTASWYRLWIYIRGILRIGWIMRRVTFGVVAGSSYQCSIL